MVITFSPRAKGRERIQPTSIGLWHALAIGPVCRMQCTWTSEPAKPRSLARGRSLSDQINSDMSTDISTCHTAVASMHLLGGLGYVLAWESANQLRFACPYLAFARLQHSAGPPPPTNVRNNVVEGNCITIQRPGFSASRPQTLGAATTARNAEPVSTASKRSYKSRSPNGSMFTT